MRSGEDVLGTESEAMYARKPPSHEDGIRPKAGVQHRPPQHTTGKSIEIDRRSWAQGLLEVSALSVVVFQMLVGSVAADTKATKGNADAQHHNHITFPCTSCGLASEVAMKPFLLGGALQENLCA